MYFQFSDRCWHIADKLHKSNFLKFISTPILLNQDLLFHDILLIGQSVYKSNSLMSSLVKTFCRKYLTLYYCTQRANFNCRASITEKSLYLVFKLFLPNTSLQHLLPWSDWREKKKERKNIFKKKIPTQSSFKISFIHSFMIYFHLHCLLYLVFQIFRIHKLYMRSALTLRS